MTFEESHHHVQLRRLGESWLCNRIYVLSELFAHHVSCGQTHNDAGMRVGMNVMRLALALADHRALAALNQN